MFKRLFPWPIGILGILCEFAGIGLLFSKRPDYSLAIGFIIAGAIFIIAVNVYKEFYNKDKNDMKWITPIHDFKVLLPNKIITLKEGKVDDQ